MAMGEMKDYSGDFRPDTGWESFPRELLLEALKLYGKLFLAIDGFWYLSVKDRFGDKTAIERDLWAWNKYFRYETKHITKLLNITGNDIESFFKILQFSPWSWNIKFKADLINQNHGTIRVQKCPTLEALIKEGGGREKYFCREVETKMFEMQARALNPDISVKALQIPPETIGSGVCCEWEVRI